MGKLPAPVYADGLRKNTQMRFNGYEALGTEGAIRDMKNMTSDFWPELAVRDKRATLNRYVTSEGLAAWNELMFFNGKLFYGLASGGEGIDLPGYSYDHYTFAALGDYITIWPRKVWYLPAKPYSAGGGTIWTDPEYGLLEASLTTGEESASFLSEASPEGLSDTANCLYLHMTAAGTIRPGDAVTISGCTMHAANNKTLIVREVSGMKLYFYDESFEMPTDMRYYVRGTMQSGRYTFGRTKAGLDENGNWQPSYFLCITLTTSLTGGYLSWDKEAEVVDYFDENGSPAGAWSVVQVLSAADAGTEIAFELAVLDYTEPGAVTVARTVPDMDYVFAHENRLFGYKGDTIYASKWGDPFNWNVFDGLSTDSWSTETGTPGNFTGGISYGGYARFFKENNIFTLYGDYPGEFSLQSQEQIGVEEGSERSLANVNGRLMYLSPKGPCVYAGGTPALIGESLGQTKYKNGVGGTDGVKYYLSMEDKEGTWGLFVYDTRRGLWMKEDDLHATAMAKYKNLVWCLRYNSGGSSKGLMVLGHADELPNPDNAASRYITEDDVEWFVEFGDILEGSPDRKRLAKLQVRLEMEEGSYAEVLLKYDSEPSWHRIDGMTADRKRSVVLPVVPRRLDHFRLKIQGRGGCRISSITRQVAAGSDRR